MLVKCSHSSVVTWTLDCITPCKSPILLYFLGPDSPSVHHVLQAPDTIEVKCMFCRQTHTYRRDEVHTKIGVPPAARILFPILKFTRASVRDLALRGACAFVT